MAKYGGGITGSFSGKVGTVIGSNWRKINYMKSLPDRFKRDSPAQLAQQDKWRMMVAFLSPLIPVLERGFSREDTRKKTAYNIAMSYNLLYAVKQNEAGFEIDFKNVQLSRGSLPRAAGIKIDNGAEGEFVISWSPLVTSPMISGDDLVNIVMYCPAVEKHVTKICERRDGRVTLSVPKVCQGQILHFFIFFTSANGDNSPSYYIGEYRGIEPGL